MILNGVVEFGFQLVAIQKPVTSYFIDLLDVQAMRDYWNRLEPGVLVYDSVAYRSPTIFGRDTDASITWYAFKPDWKDLRNAPHPAALRAYGFSYAYIDDGYFNSLSPSIQQELSGGCVKLVKEYSGPTRTFRRLLDIRGCQ